MAKRKTGTGTDGAAAREAPDAHEMMRAAILEATLAHVPFEGWTLGALKAGAADAGYDAAQALNAFPNGILEAIEHHSRLADARMMAAMETAELASMRTRERVAFAVRARLEANTAHREAIRRALAILALPTNVGVSLTALYRTVDAIWYGAGDTAVDFNFYTKRGLLAGVYMATLLHWLDDASEGQERTWAFLERRLDEVLKVPRLLGEFTKIFKGFPFPGAPRGQGPAAGA